MKKYHVGKELKKSPTDVNKHIMGEGRRSQCFMKHNLFFLKSRPLFYKPKLELLWIKRLIGEQCTP